MKAASTCVTTVSSLSGRIAEVAADAYIVCFARIVHWRRQRLRFLFCTSRVKSRSSFTPTSTDPTVRQRNMKTSRKPASRNFPEATKSKRKTYKGIRIMFEGVLYQSLSGFAEEYGLTSAMTSWLKQQLSKRPLNDRLRFLPSEYLLPKTKSVPRSVREGKVDAKNMDKIFVPADRERNRGNANLFKSTVL